MDARESWALTPRFRVQNLSAARRALAAVIGALGAITMTSMIILPGCQSEYRSDTKRMVELFVAGQFEEASSDAVREAEAELNDEQNRVAYDLEAGRTLQADGQWKASMQWFETAHEIVRPFLDTQAEAKVTEAFATTLINQTTSIYRATPNERIMMCTLQSLNAMVLGDWDRARVELRRAQDWQQDARSRYSDAVERAQKDTNAAQKKEGINANSMIGGATFKNGLAKAPRILSDLKGYGDYANPFTYWLRGTFLSLAPGTNSQDRDNAQSDFKFAASMLDSPAREFVLAEAARLASGSTTHTPTWYLVQFAGLAPKRNEFKVTIPLPINGTIVLVTAAYPYIESSGASVGGAQLSAGNAAAVQSVPLADFNRIVSAEFDEVKGIIYAQETLSASIKAVASYAAQSAAGSDYAGWVALAAAIGQLATQAADLRSWRTLPQTIYVAAMPTPPTGAMEVQRSDGAHIASVTVEPGSSGLILVTTPATGVPSKAFIIPFSTRTDGKSET